MAMSGTGLKGRHGIAACERRLEFARRALAAAVAACSLALVPRVVVGGAPGSPPAARAFSATGALVTRPFSSPILVCTATVVAPRVLITAAHCAALCAAQPLEFTLKADPAGAQAPLGVTLRRAYLHPAYDLRADTSLHDIALIELDEPLAHANGELVLDPADTAWALRAGLQVALVGYGEPRANGGQQGAKYTAAATITRLDADEMTIGAPGEPRSLAGDSGGPAFVFYPDGTRRLAGIVSRSASDAPGEVGGAIHTRVDAYADWIAATLHAIGKDKLPSKSGGAGCTGSLHGCRSILCRHPP